MSYNDVDSNILTFLQHIQTVPIENLPLFQLLLVPTLWCFFYVISYRTIQKTLITTIEEYPNATYNNSQFLPFKILTNIHRNSNNISAIVALILTSNYIYDFPPDPAWLNEYFKLMWGSAVGIFVMLCVLLFISLIIKLLLLHTIGLFAKFKWTAALNKYITDKEFINNLHSKYNEITDSYHVCYYDQESKTDCHLLDNGEIVRYNVKEVEDAIFEILSIQTPNKNKMTIKELARAQIDMLQCLKNTKYEFNNSKDTPDITLVHEGKTLILIDGKFIQK